MKILRKPKLLPMGCKRCGCVFQAKLWDLKFSAASKTKDEIVCPTCKTINKAIFDLTGTETENNNET
jgi:rubredoxin